MYKQLLTVSVAAILVSSFVQAQGGLEGEIRGGVRDVENRLRRTLSNIHVPSEARQLGNEASQEMQRLRQQLPNMPSVPDFHLPNMPNMPNMPKISMPDMSSLPELPRAPRLPSMRSLRNEMQSLERDMASTLSRIPGGSMAQDLINRVRGIVSRLTPSYSSSS